MKTGIVTGRAALLEVFKSDLEASLGAFHNHACSHSAKFIRWH